MAKKYKGSLSLEWFNKQKAIVNLNEDSIKSANDIPAPRINWINKEEALFYELNEEEGKGNTPYWVNRDDIRVKEARPLVFQKAYKAIQQDKPGTLPGTDTEFRVQEINNEEDALDIENMLIKGDNLLALNTLKKYFDKLPDDEKVKCIFIDPPYNTGSAFEQYDDNLEHSEWLTLMRDRLVKLRDLLSSKGSIWITIDDDESHYLKILCDDIFGRNNFVANVIWEKVYSPRMDATGFSVSHDHILVYSKSDLFEVNQLESEQNTKQFSKFDIKKAKYYRPRTLRKEGSKSLKEDRESMYYPLIAPDGTEVYPIKPDGRLGRWRMMKSTFEEEFDKGNIEWENKGGKWEIIVKQWKKENPTAPPTTYWNITDTVSEQSLNKEFISWLKQENKLTKLLKEFSNSYKSELTLSSSTSGHNHEAKEEVKSLNPDDVFDTPKPERLIQRIFEIASNEGDLVLDIFGGSGTTFSVAHKMKRKWIGCEIGDHADTHIIPRLKGVVDGSDKVGITKNVNWQGGGSFKYYHLGESIISIDNETKKGEFNWSLGKQFIQESLLQSYDFVVKDINVFPAQIFQDEENKSTVGKIVGNSNKAVYGLAYLASPKESNLTITNEEVKSIYNILKKESDFQSLVIYTNKGIDLAQDTIPGDLDIIKVPNAIFSELER